VEGSEVLTSRFQEKKRFQVSGKDWGVSKMRTNFFEMKSQITKYK
jgi:hypothetical protein